ncbi:unnamed protein product [Cyprideis torosa]|uniref:Uncharacterized protein n=1 Tax=Cyprideis torosa TaxID=163714 RepID=A0A7R8WER9_9CRUS|nr:unnamed protein product [Cyprideis torosa]CAG0894650.1 unnamed protein product [Cyprideis torosa]
MIPRRKVLALVLGFLVLFSLFRSLLEYKGISDTAEHLDALLRRDHFPSWLHNYIEQHRGMLQRRMDENQYLVFRVSKDHRYVQGGLGNRMLGLFMAFFYAIATDRVFLIYWDKPYNITNLFRPATLDWNFQSVEVYNRSTKYSFIDQSFSRGNWNHPTSWPQFTAVAINPVDSLFKLEFQPKPIKEYFQRMNLQDTTMNFDHAYHALFKPTGELSESVAKLRKSAGLKVGEPFVSMHMRYGKYGNLSWSDPQRSHPNDTALVLSCARKVQANLSREMSPKTSQVPLVFFSDSSEMKEKVVKDNPDVRTTRIPRVSHTERTSNISVEDWRNTWAEFLLMSEARCTVKLGGPGNPQIESLLSSSHPSAKKSLLTSSHPSAKKFLLTSSHPSAKKSLLTSSHPSAKKSLLPSSHPSAKKSLLISSHPSAKKSLLTSSHPSAKKSLLTSSHPSAKKSLITPSHPSAKKSLITPSHPSGKKSLLTYSAHELVGWCTRTGWLVHPNWLVGAPDLVGWFREDGRLFVLTGNGITKHQIMDAPTSARSILPSSEHHGPGVVSVTTHEISLKKDLVLSAPTPPSSWMTHSIALHLRITRNTTGSILSSAPPRRAGTWCID